MQARNKKFLNSKFEYFEIQMQIENKIQREEGHNNKVGRLVREVALELCLIENQQVDIL